MPIRSKTPKRKRKLKRKIKKIFKIPTNDFSIFISLSLLIIIGIVYDYKYKEPLLKDYNEGFYILIPFIIFILVTKLINECLDCLVN
jgi:F0F1-type ATP synthase membrane subunit a